MIKMIISLFLPLLLGCYIHMFLINNVISLILIYVLFINSIILMDRNSVSYSEEIKDNNIHKTLIYILIAINISIFLIVSKTMWNFGINSDIKVQILSDILIALFTGYIIYKKCFMEHKFSKIISKHKR